MTRAIVIVWLCGLAQAETPIAVDPKVRDAMALCTDGKSHYVGIAKEMEGSPLFYGDGKKLYHLAEQGKFMSPEWFFEPRQLNKHNNENFRGYDWRVYSHVDYDADKKSCSVTCGERRTDLKIVPADE